MHSQCAHRLSRRRACAGKWLDAARLSRHWLCIQLGSTSSEEAWTVLHALSGQGRRLAVNRPSPESLTKLASPACSVQAPNQVLWSRQWWSQQWGAFANLYSPIGLEAIIKRWCDRSCMHSAGGDFASPRPIRFSLKDNAFVMHGQRVAAFSENVLWSALDQGSWIAVPSLLLHNVQTASVRAKHEIKYRHGRKVNFHRTAKQVRKVHIETRRSAIDVMRIVWCQPPPGLSDVWLTRLYSAMVKEALDLGCRGAGLHWIDVSPPSGGAHPLFASLLFAALPRTIGHPPARTKLTTTCHWVLVAGDSNTRDALDILVERRTSSKLLAAVKRWPPSEVVSEAWAMKLCAEDEQRPECRNRQMPCDARWFDVEYLLTYRDGRCTAISFRFMGLRACDRGNCSSVTNGADVEVLRGFDTLLPAPAPHVCNHTPADYSRLVSCAAPRRVLWVCT